MPSTNTKWYFRILASDQLDYSDIEESFEEGKEFSVALNRRQYDSFITAVAPATIAIGTEAVVGLYVKNTGPKSVIVKWTQNTNANEQALGEASAAGPTIAGADNGEWMFVPKVDSSTNITLESPGGASSARVLILHA